MTGLGKNVVKLAVTIVITLGFISLGIIAPVFLLVRFTVLLIAQARRRGLAEMMSGLSQVFALESFLATSSCNIVLHCVFDGQISLESLRESFVDKMLPSVLNPKSDPYARLRQIYLKYMGFIWWLWEADFRIEQHIRVYDFTDSDLAIPAGICSEDDLKEITAPLLAKPFEAGQSPWELLLIENYRSNENFDGHPQCVFTLRIHHALADGISIVQMLIHLVGGDEVAGFMKPKFTPPSVAEKVLKILLVALRGPFDLASTYTDCFDSPNSWYMKDKRRPKEYHAFFSNTIPVWKVKEIMKKHSVCYNAVLYSVTAGAIVKLMDEAGQEVPAKLSTLFSYPLADRPEGLANHVLVMFTLLSLNHFLNRF